MPAILVVGLFVGGALSNRPPVPVNVADGVSLAPPADWEFATRLEPQPDGDEGVVLTRGSATMIVYTNPLAAADELADLAAELTEEGLVSVGDTRMQDVGGRPAQRFSFTGTLPALSATPLEGEATAVRGAEVTVVFAAWAEVGAYELVRPEIDRMIAEVALP